ncbi:MAG: ferredoxin [Chloroflexi bacterium]|nr:ferredoxin [Chloroflexota bacterium]
MTTTYDPGHPAYFDEGDLRQEIARVFDLCHGCRLCWNLCPAFGSLFESLDRHDGRADVLSSAEQDRVADECYQCKLCAVKCPCTPPHDWDLDFPRLMLRALAVRYRRQGGDLADHLLGRPDLVGRVATILAPAVNAALRRPGSLPRRIVEKTVGVAARRSLPLYTRQRFSTWFKRRPPTVQARNGAVAIFQTCLVEYQNPAIGQDAVKVYERNGIACSVPAGTVCCGMPLLDAGNVRAFVRQAKLNVRILADEVRQGRDVVVLQPTCGYALRREYPHYLGYGDARLVAAHTYDVAEYLMRMHRQEGKGLDLDFAGPVPTAVTLHAPCHLRAQQAGMKGRDLIRLTGATVTVVERCAGVDGGWGLRAKNDTLARKVAVPLTRAVEKAGGEVIAGDCCLAGLAIAEETGRTPVHPIQILARAYGFPEEPQP